MKKNLKKVSGGEVTVNKKECIGCGACAENCPGEAITINDIAEIDYSKCLGCGTCASVCPQGAVDWV